MASSAATPDTGSLFALLGATVTARLSEQQAIRDERKRQLTELAQWIRAQRYAGRPARLVFICTHNSRRSHISQVWAQTAAGVFGVDGVETYSGGTETTAFNPRAVAALERAGFSVARKTDGDNPVYAVTDGPEAAPMEAFSKVFDDDANPKADFAAVMTCTQADEGCPFVPGAAFRKTIAYEDPKAFDGTDRESAAYDERVAQIGRELLFLFSTLRA